jgi:hypothetical protein
MYFFGYYIGLSCSKTSLSVITFWCYKYAIFNIEEFNYPTDEMVIMKQNVRRKMVESKGL